MKVLVAVDDSKVSEAAIKNMTDYFRPDVAEVRILHVLTPIEFSVPLEVARGYAPELEEQAKQARALVNKYAEQVRAAGYKAECVVETGDPCETIISTVTNWKADLLVMGSHGHRGIARLLLGNVAYSVVRRATCSVWIVRLPVH